MEFSYEAMSSVPLGRQSVSHDSHMTSFVQYWGHLFAVVSVLVLCHVTGHVTGHVTSFAYSVLDILKKESKALELLSGLKIKVGVCFSGGRMPHTKLWNELEGVVSECTCVQGDDIQKLLLVPVHLGQNKYLIDMRHPDVVVSHVTSCDIM